MPLKNCDVNRAALKRAQDDVFVVQSKSKASTIIPPSEVICFDSDEDAPPAKRPRTTIPSTPQSLKNKVTGRANATASSSKSTANSKTTAKRSATPPPPKSKKGLSLQAHDKQTASAMSRWKSGDGVLVGATAPVIAQSILGSMISAKAAEHKQAVHHTRILSLNGQGTLIQLKHQIRETVGEGEGGDLLEQIDRLLEQHAQVQQAMNDDSRFGRSDKIESTSDDEGIEGMEEDNDEDM